MLVKENFTITDKKLTYSGIFFLSGGVLIVECYLDKFIDNMYSGIVKKGLLVTIAMSSFILILSLFYPWGI